MMSLYYGLMTIGVTYNVFLLEMRPRGPEELVSITISITLEVSEITNGSIPSLLKEPGSKCTFHGKDRLEKSGLSMLEISSHW